MRDFDLSSRLESTANTAREFALPVAERQGYHEWATALCGSGAGAWWFASLGSLNQNGRDLSNSRLRWAERDPVSFIVIQDSTPSVFGRVLGRSLKLNFIWKEL